MKQVDHEINYVVYSKWTRVASKNFFVNKEEKWCNANGSDMSYCHIVSPLAIGTHWYFENKADAMLFILRWT